MTDKGKRLNKINPEVCAAFKVKEFDEFNQ